jgi:hypothetical protein
LARGPGIDDLPLRADPGECKQTLLPLAEVVKALVTARDIPRRAEHFIRRNNRDFNKRIHRLWPSSLLGVV